MSLTNHVVHWLMLSNHCKYQTIPHATLKGRAQTKVAFNWCLKGNDIDFWMIDFNVGVLRHIRHIRRKLWESRSRPILQILNDVCLLFYVAGPRGETGVAGPRGTTGGKGQKGNSESKWLARSKLVICLSLIWRSKRH